MADAYLNLAEAVLLSERKPLRPREILERAYVTELIPWHLHGVTQDKTLHARMSEDITRNPASSRFYRTAPGTFFLHHLRSDPTIPDAFKGIYHAPPRRKELKRDPILTIQLPRTQLDDDGIATIGLAEIESLLEHGRYSYERYRDVASDANLAVVHSFLIVHRDLQVLSYRCGKFFPATDPLYGRRTIGLGGAVLAADQDLLFNSLYGVVGNGINELTYGIGLPRRLAERARYEEEVQPRFGIILRRELGQPTVLHVVLGYACPEEFTPSKAALSVNDLRWIDALTPANYMADYDLTSRFLLSNDRLHSVLAGGR